MIGELIRTAQHTRQRELEAEARVDQPAQRFNGDDGGGRRVWVKITGKAGVQPPWVYSGVIVKPPAKGPDHSPIAWTVGVSIATIINLPEYYILGAAPLPIDGRCIARATQGGDAYYIEVVAYKGTYL